jgi:hypothetical protein
MQARLKRRCPAVPGVSVTGVVLALPASLFYGTAIIKGSGCAGHVSDGRRLSPSRGSQYTTSCLVPALPGWGEGHS